MLVAAVVAIVAHIVLFHTRFGTHLLATGGDPEAARAMGINTDRVKIAAYTISGFLAGLASILLTARIGAAEPGANTTFLLNSVAAVVLGGVSLFGGRGNMIGPVVGALLLTALVNGLTLLGVSQFYQQLALDFPAFFGALAAINYAGPVTFESFSSAVTTPGLSSTLAIWRNTWTDSLDLARHGREFIDAGLRGALVAPTGA